MTKVGNLEEFYSSMVNDIESTDEPKRNEKVQGEDTEIDVSEEVVDTDETEDENETITSDANSEDESGEDLEDSEEEVDTEESEESEDESGTEVEYNKEEESLLEFEEEIQEPELDEDLLGLSKDLGFGDIKSKKEFIEKAQQLKELRELQKDVPVELAEALEVAKKGGDYKELLEINAINYDSYSNRELVEAAMEKYFKKEDGTIDEERLLEEVEAKSSADINMLGDQIRDNLKNKQSQRRSEYLSKVNHIKQEENKKVQSYLDSVNSIAGVKLSTVDKQNLFKEISEGSLVNSVFKGEDGKPDPKKTVENLFKIKYFDKVLSIAKNKSVNEGKKEVIKKLTNSNVSKDRKKETRVTSKASQPSALDSYLEALKKGI